MYKRCSLAALAGTGGYVELDGSKTVYDKFGLAKQDAHFLEI
jgi:hypothetical protein